MTYTLPELPFAADALEPVIDEQTMRTHHGKHHAGYVQKLNDVLDGQEHTERPIEDILQHLDELPDSIREPVRNHGGGHFNHSLFWSTLNPPDCSVPVEGEVAQAIDQSFESFEIFQDRFKQAALGRFGSGWAWLCVRPDGSLHVLSTPNQDVCFLPESLGGLGPDHKPILGLDVWEHAYYLQYQNQRAEYVDAWWCVVNWQQVRQNYLMAVGLQASTTN